MSRPAQLVLADVRDVELFAGFYLAEGDEGGFVIVRGRVTHLVWCATRWV